MKTKNFEIAKLKSFPLQDQIYGSPSRREFEDLLDNIEANGLREPPVVTTDGVILDGHQRVEVMRQLGKTHIEVSIAEGMNERDQETYFLEANAIRRQVDPVCRARIIERKFELERKNGEKRYYGNAIESEFRDRIGEQLGVSGRQASRYLQLIRQPRYIQDAVSSGEVPMTLAIKVDGFTKTEAAELQDRVDAGEAVAVVIKDILEANSVVRETKNQFIALSRFLEKNLSSLEQAANQQPVDIPLDDQFISRVDRAQSLLTTLVGLTATGAQCTKDDASGEY